MGERDAELLVLGGGGFLGRRLTLRAAAAGLSVVAALRRPAGLGASPALRTWDALAPDATARLLDAVRPRCVVLAAALSRALACERDPELARRLNADLPAELAALCATRGVRWVHVSTDLVFGGCPPRGERYAEDDPPSPLHVYGRTKAEGEDRALEVGGGLVVRLPLLFGDSDGRGLGASDGLLAALEEGRRPALFRDEHRTPLDVANAADALLEVASRGLEGYLHVAGPERLSRLELGLAVLCARGMSREEALRRVRDATRSELGMAARPADVSLDAGRARAWLRTPLLAPGEALVEGGLA